MTMSKARALIGHGGVVVVISFFFLLTGIPIIQGFVLTPSTSSHVATASPGTTTCSTTSFGINSSQGQLSLPPLFSRNGNDRDENSDNVSGDYRNPLATLIASLFLSSSLLFSTMTVIPTPSFAAGNPQDIVSCLFSSCQLPLAKCVANPKCLANVICINTCNGKEDETGCQIKCGDIFENQVVGEFNKCALSEKNCVPQRQDDGSYPVPPSSALVQSMDTKFFEGRLYITAGQNLLFDIFPCQVHFFTETSKGNFYGKLNWRISEPDGEFFNRDAIQRFVQDPKQPGHFLNHDNEYLHYQDDWYVLDYEQDGNAKDLPPFVLIYYRGSNDAWDGYGGAFVYTREASLPEVLKPRLREAAAKVGYDFDKDFVITDNSCREQTPEQRLQLREKFLGKAIITTEKQIQLEATKARGEATNGVKAQKLYLENEVENAQNAVKYIGSKTAAFERELANDVAKVEKEVVQDVVNVERSLVGGIKKGQ
mmetsp:Transcript_32599/g.75013  ORF Transcript_32599/g.75013 Transcript_32599/m.75013 type:complete len:482 (-) Transcript_32599:70-1515(-)